MKKGEMFVVFDVDSVELFATTFLVMFLFVRFHFFLGAKGLATTLVFFFL